MLGHGDTEVKRTVPTLEFVSKGMHLNVCVAGEFVNFDSNDLRILSGTQWAALNVSDTLISISL